MDHRAAVSIPKLFIAKYHFSGKSLKISFRGCHIKSTEQDACKPLESVE